MKNQIVLISAIVFLFNFSERRVLNVSITQDLNNFVRLVWVFEVNNKDPKAFGYSVDEGGEFTAKSISIKDSLVYILDLFHKNMKVINIHTGNKEIIDVTQVVSKDFFPNECVLFNEYIYILGLDGTIIKMSDGGKFGYQKKIDKFYGDKYILEIDSIEFKTFMVGMWSWKDNIKGNGPATLEYIAIDRNDNISKRTEKIRHFDFDKYYDYRDIKGKIYDLNDSCVFNAMGKSLRLDECGLSSRIDFNFNNVVQFVKKEDQILLYVYNW